jgi:hypothetical protein
VELLGQISLGFHRTHAKVVVSFLLPAFYVICSQILQSIIEEKKEEKSVQNDRNVGIMNNLTDSPLGIIPTFNYFLGLSLIYP